MFKRTPLAITILIAAMLIGLVGHGFELFFPVEGGNYNKDFWFNLFPVLKASGFAVVFEVANAIGLFICFNRQTKGATTRWTALIIGIFCYATSVVIQYHYFKGRIEFDGWYSIVLPTLVGLLSALGGLLDRDQAEEITSPTQVTSAPALDLTPLLHRLDRLVEQQGNIRETVEVLAGKFEALEDRVEKIERPRPLAMPKLRIVGEGAADGGGERPDIDELLKETAPVLVSVGSAEPSRAEKIRQMRDNGAKWEEIAAYFGKGVRTVQQWAKE